jgi:hypothetical protein
VVTVSVLCVTFPSTLTTVVDTVTILVDMLTRFLVTLRAVRNMYPLGIRPDLGPNSYSIGVQVHFDRLIRVTRISNTKRTPSVYPSSSFDESLSDNRMLIEDITHLRPSVWTRPGVDEVTVNGNLAASTDWQSHWKTET